MAAFYANHTFQAEQAIPLHPVTEWPEWTEGASASVEPIHTHLALQAEDESAPLSPHTRRALEDFFGPSEEDIQVKRDAKSLTGKADRDSTIVSAETVSSATVNANGDEEQLIWRMTEEYLGCLQSFCTGPGRQPLSVLASKLVESHSSDDALKSRQLAFVLQALDLASQTTNPSESVSMSSPSSKTAQKSHLRLGPAHDFVLSQEGKQKGFCKGRDFRMVPKAKTGRKPEKFCCFLCHSVFPYKKNLIRHFQSDHGISRCQSLLYKRLNQGEEQFKRLYMEEEEGRSE